MPFIVRYTALVLCLGVLSIIIVLLSEVKTR